MATDNQNSEATFVIPPNLQAPFEIATPEAAQSEEERKREMYAEAADRVLNGSPVTRLSARDSEMLMKMLDDPDPPLNESLLNQIRKYKEWVKVNE